jgi:hypothetical protein
MTINIIEIHCPIDPARCHSVYFTDTRGKKVKALTDEPDRLLSVSQKEDLFLSDKYNYKFEVPDSVIKDLEKMINWPV